MKEEKKIASNDKNEQNEYDDIILSLKLCYEYVVHMITRVTYMNIIIIHQKKMKREEKPRQKYFSSDMYQYSGEFKMFFKHFSSFQTIFEILFILHSSVHDP